MEQGVKSMNHRLFKVLFVLFNLLILAVPFTYYDSYKYSLETESKYNVRCIDNGALYVLHGDSLPMDLMQAQMKNLSDVAYYEDKIRFGCAYHSERQPFLDAFAKIKSVDERIAQLDAYQAFEESKPKITANNFEYVEIIKERNFDFYYRFVIEPILVMIGIWLVLQVWRIVYQRNILGIFTWHPYSLSKGKPLSQKAKFGFGTSYEWARESYKLSIITAMDDVKNVSIVFLLMTGPFLWLYGYLLWNIGLEGMLKISLVVGAVVLIPLFIIWVTYVIKKKVQTVSYLQVAFVSFLGLLISLTVSILWLAFYYLEKEVITTTNLSTILSLTSIVGLIGFIYTFKLIRIQFNLIYTNYLKNKYADPESKTIDSADRSLTVFLFRLIYPRVDATKTLPRVILVIGWIVTVVTWGIGLFIYFSIIQRVIYFVIYGDDLSKWKVVKELTLE